MADNDYSRGEELAHCATHVLGVVASLAGIARLLATAVANGASPWRAGGGVIFGASALLLFTTSVLYHGSTSPRLKPRLRLLDHSAIYVLIAGTYTPFALGVLGGRWGWTLFGLVWGLALAGIAAKLTLGRSFGLIPANRGVVAGGPYLMFRYTSINIVAFDDDIGAGHGAVYLRSELVRYPVRLLQ